MELFSPDLESIPVWRASRQDAVNLNNVQEEIIGSWQLDIVFNLFDSHCGTDRAKRKT